MSASTETLRLKIRLFGGFRPWESLCGGDLELTVAEGTTAAQVREAAGQALEALRPGALELARVSALGTAERCLPSETVIHDEGPLALLPPVSGG